jgi:hypothetical protein
MSETDTAEIDNRMTGEKQPSDFAKFGKSCFFILILILGYFFSGTIVLYGCRLAQSCMLPIYENEYPYTDIKDGGDNRRFWTNLFYSDKGSHHISFNSGEYKLIPALIHYRDTINVRFINYMLTNIISLLQFSYSATDSVLKSVNSVCSENVIIALSPFILGLLSFILMVGNTGYLVYLWFKNLGLFYKDSVEEDGKLKWTKDVSWIFPKLGAFCWSMALFISFFFLYPTFPFIASSLLPIVLLTIMSYAGVYNDGVKDAETNLMGVFQLILKYYKSIVLILLGIGFSSAASTHLGSGTGSTLLGMVILITIMEYFGIINMFKSIPLENLMESMNFKPAFELVKEKLKGGGYSGGGHLKKQLSLLQKTS